jgi:hypothetical protein
MKNAQFYLLAMQSSAAHPHTPATELVQSLCNSSLFLRDPRGLADFQEEFA